jgi:WXXGXW repeat (2 copies)
MKKTVAILGLAMVGLTALNANAGVHFGINIGVPLPAPLFVAHAPVIVQPPMPAPIVETVPVCPTPGYVWVDGSWGWCDNHWAWTRGHWGPSAHWSHGGHWDRGFHAEGHDGFRGGFHAERGRR